MVLATGVPLDRTPWLGPRRGRVGGAQDRCGCTVDHGSNRTGPWADRSSRAGHVTDHPITDEPSGDALCAAYRVLGFESATKDDNVFRDLASSRIIDPTSKVDASRVPMEVGAKSFRMLKHDLEARPIYHHKRESIDAHLTTVFAALVVTHWIEHQTGWSINKFVRTARRYRTVKIKAGSQILAGADPTSSAKPPPRSTAALNTNLSQVRSQLALEQYLSRISGNQLYRSNFPDGHRRVSAGQRSSSRHSEPRRDLGVTSVTAHDHHAEIAWRYSAAARPIAVDAGHVDAGAPRETVQRDGRAERRRH
jgi:hypothetical protein